MTWFEMLNDEFQWGMLDADSLKQYVPNSINQNQYNQIVGSNK